ncbi:GAF domain-containing protein [Deinococcus metalli]|uniref:histidine kinase n=1 Tax=Deinococcus metalli TaxID=1141878 RepID=A0A7W8KF66_9DEIO|nr:GAF domain-containing protein [Deinococcus metalli]MBB5377006.1 GAF domain-containing protein [Deinococcus metalli]GHF47000.1 hypothetical protein GCM10017781_24350 [Deinococcus metalli]
MAVHVHPISGPFDVLVVLGSPPGDLGAVLSNLPAGLGAAVLIAPGDDLTLEALAPLPVQWAEHGLPLEPGRLYVTPPGTVVEVRTDRRCAVTSAPDGAPERPLDRLLASLAITCGARTLAVVCGGSGRDGVAGAQALRGAGGTVLVLLPEGGGDGVPSAVVEADAADVVTAPQDLGRTVAALLTGGPPGTSRADTAEQQPAFLLQLSDALRPLADPVAVMGVACRMLGEHLAVDRTYYVEVDEAAGVARVARDWVQGGVSLAGEHRVADFGWSVAILRRGECHVIPDTQFSPVVPPEDRPASAALGIIGCMGAPLIKDGRLVGALCVTTLVPRAWTAREVKLLRDVGERIWSAVERARAEEALRAREEKYRTLFNSIDEGFHIIELLYDPSGRPVDYRFVEANPAFEGQTGLRGAVGQLGSHVAPGTERSWLEAYDRVIQSGVALRFEDYDAFTQHWYAVYASRVGERDGHQVAVVFSDVTERKRREANLSFLNAVGSALEQLTNVEETMELLGEKIGAHFGLAHCRFVELDPAGEVAVVFHGWRRPDVPTITGPHRMSDYLAPEFKEKMRAGTTVIVRDVWNDPLTDGGRFAALGIGSFVAVPLVRDGRWLAWLGLYRSEAHGWPDDDVELARELTARIWTRLERARAEAAVRALNATLEARVQERTHRLAEMNSELQVRTRALEAFAELTQDLGVEVDPYALVRQGQRVALSLLPQGFATYYELHGTLWRLRVQEGDMRAPALQAAADAGVPAGHTPSLDRPWETGAPVFQSSYDRDADGLGALGHEVTALATLPLVVGGRRQGVFAVALFSGRQWTGSDRAVLETVVHSLSLALERAQAVRALAEEREALATFAHFTELSAGTRDVEALARQATAVLGQVLDVHSAVYFEQDGELWRLRHASTTLEPELDTALRRGVPAGLPGFAVPAERREPVFFEHVTTEDPPPPVTFQAVAAYPLFPPHHPAGMLSMAVTDRAAWTEREKAVFRAVGDSFRLAVERTAQLQQVERHRERLADLNAELGTLITRTARNLELPVGYLNQFLSPSRLNDLPAALPLSVPSALHDELSRLRGVAQDLRQLAQLENQTLSRELLPLGELVAQVRAQSAAAGRVAWLTLALPIVRADRALLMQALEVLLTFTLSETRGARVVEVSSQEVGAEVWVTVQDDGIGLEPEEAATLFDLAVRTEQSVPLLDGGGLVRVRRVMARHGGWAWAEARLDGGRIVLAFPRDETVSVIENLLQQ